MAEIDARVPPDVVVPMERELEQRAAAVGEVTEGKVKPGFMTSSELDALPAFLERGETLAVVTRADLGWRAGVLAATSRRLLFLYLEDLVRDVPLDSIRAVEIVESGWAGRKLVVRTDEGELTFTNVTEDRLDEAVAALLPPSSSRAAPRG